MPKQLTGQRFGRLVVCELAEPATTPSGRRIRRWHVVCDCGAKLIVRQHNLITGSTRSCGCLAREVWRGQIRERNRTHGMSTSDIYQVWRNMLARCTNPKAKGWKNYGGRGVCL